MSARDTLTPELRAEVLRLEDDLRARVTAIPEMNDAWRAEYEAARAAERTAAAWEAWVDDRVTLAAVAWVLTTVFVRFCEDNALVTPVWISGPRHREAIDAQQQFLRETARTKADVTDREWLLQAVDYLQSLPATAGLVDDTSPMWLVTPSGDAATRLLNFWRERDESGALIRDLSDADLDTRFLGDLYQEISEDAKKRYALLQTPVFVEEFILDRTLEPALNERPLAGFKMIDPTCGSGHFLLGGFRRLLDRWHRHAPGLDERERVQAALDSVYGVDLNPFAVAIARFRLTVAALQACALVRLEDAPAFRYHLAAGDSLLHGLDQGELDLGMSFVADQVATSFAYATENLTELRMILANGSYDAVVGNPPYIQVKDAKLSALYRQIYSSCSGQYALTVPFMERFFALAKPGSPVSGWVGQITSNSFMKREFGGKLVREYLPTRDLRLVIDSEGAWIPGHNMDGTPTVILVGRNQQPMSGTIRAVLSKGRRESPGSPDGRGPYWTGITEHLDDPEFDNDWLTVTDLARDILGEHPWSLSGGGALELRQALEGRPNIRLSSHAASVGFLAITREDEAYLLGEGTLRRRGVDKALIRTLVEGTGVRDWDFDDSLKVLCTYDEAGKAVIDQAAERLLWPLKQFLLNRKALSGTQLEQGLEWWEYSQLNAKRYAADRLVAMSEIASHNHFAFDRGERLFSRTSPVIQFKEGVGDETEVGVIAALNSSATCFWLKQVCKPKGGAADHAWSRTYQFNANTVAQIPLPRNLPTALGSAILTLVAERSNYKARIDAAPSREGLNSARDRYATLCAKLVTLQEELDWDVYQRFGLIEDDLTYSGDDLPALRVGERAFEILLARRIASGAESSAWFEKHGARPLTEIPGGWPESYRRLVRRRIELIESQQSLGLLERPEHKRRWAADSWEKQEARALRRWILGRIDEPRFWFDTHGRPTTKSVAVLADDVARDEELVAALALLEGRPDVSVASSLTRILADEFVPHLSALRLTESGLRKWSDWQTTLRLQRMEDAGNYDPRPREQGGDGTIPLPPKYASSDFMKPSFWAHRGKLDVAKEPFIHYPGAGRDGDPSPILGWAGWDHSQQALALATLIQSGEQQGWSDERLTPLVAGLSELLPWVEQWHTDPDPLYGGGSPAEFFSGLLDSYMAKLGTTRESLAAWRPPAAKRGRKAKS